MLTWTSKTTAGGRHCTWRKHALFKLSPVDSLQYQLNSHRITCRYDQEHRRMASLLEYKGADDTIRDSIGLELLTINSSLDGS